MNRYTEQELVQLLEEDPYWDFAPPILVDEYDDELGIIEEPDSPSIESVPF